MRQPPSAPHRWRQLSSNVRHHKMKPVASPAGSAARCAEDQTATARHSREQPSPLVHLLGNGQKRAVRCPQFMKQQLNFSPSKVGASRQSCSGPRSRVCHSVLRACRRTQRRNFVQLGLRRQASSWRASLVSAERFAFASLHQNQLPQWHTTHLPVTAPVMPNPLFKPSPNGGPPGPVWRYAVHFRQPGPGVPPSVPA